MQYYTPKLQALPVELLYEVQLYALSPFLPQLSRYFFDVFNTSSASFRAQYLLGVSITTTSSSQTEIVSKALRYPLCTLPVLDLLCSRLEGFLPSSTLAKKLKCELPRRLFRPLRPREDAQPWGKTDEPLPFLLHILHKPSFPPIDPNSHQGYALTRAVHARHIPLVRLLLEIGASPACKDGMAVKVAIKQGNLDMVKMLIERKDKGEAPVFANPLDKNKGVEKEKMGKRRRLQDRIEVDQSMLKFAVKCNARDIVDYFTSEKGVVPDMQTLYSLRL